jgi:hypothetical protein
MDEEDNDRSASFLLPSFWWLWYVIKFALQPPISRFIDMIIQSSLFPVGSLPEFTPSKASFSFRVLSIVARVVLQ